MYSISYMWYAVIGTITCITVGVVIGFLTSSDSDKFDEKLLHPLIAKLSRKMPGKCRTFTSQAEKEAKTEETIDDKIFTTSSSGVYENNNVPIRTHL